ncbi:MULTISPECIES: DUF5327 family protein [Listeria]|uniref:YwdI family protein n=2 Tax=Listeria TaxID=1637 RepID=A0A7X1D2G2_9LIST|nr:MULTISPECIES: DUF5327 family protein [Listeria]EUJ45367.1 hypothetical protein PRIP_05893 [Listeria riparia FSL S10-1204]MBC1228221.1 YwdI family protein [Listeria booriae]MBC1231582.1 YwdI family protein [Listeria booriae]MBC1234176.1 YwdI family protein [Listeria booriae]MBC1247541.1 YwdI family protein [Listeria booriae]
MTVSDEALFAKMEQELQQAKIAKSEQEKQLHLHGLAVLVEVMRGAKQEIPKTFSSDLEYKAMTGELPISKPTSLESQKIETDDGANGDSLLDF